MPGRTVARPDKKPVPLLEYGKSHELKRGVPCSVCMLPQAILKQVNVAATVDPKLGRSPLSKQTISNWLRDEHQLDIPGGRIENHIKKGHARG